MPSGKGTYGSKLRRLSKEGAISSAAKEYKKAKTPAQLRKLSKAREEYKNAKTPDKKRRVNKLIKMSKEVKKTNKVKPGYKKAHDYIKKSSATLDSGGYKEEAIRVNDARDRSKKS